MKSRSLIPSVLVAVLAASAGYWAHELRDNHAGRLLAHEMPPLEAFVSDQSFSEVETAKATLQALCTRYRVESQQQRSRLLQTARKAGGAPIAQTSPSYAPAIPWLRRGIEEFRHTGQELVLMQDLLLVLAHEGQGNEWLDMYLEALYRQPTADVVGQFAQTAVRFGRALKRSPEVSDAFQHVALIPLEFAAKQQVERARTEILLVSCPSNSPAAPDSDPVCLMAYLGHP
jgi:hypothetical protein